MSDSSSDVLHKMESLLREITSRRLGRVEILSDDLRALCQELRTRRSQVDLPEVILSRMQDPDPEPKPTAKDMVNIVNIVNMAAGQPWIKSPCCIWSCRQPAVVLARFIATGMTRYYCAGCWALEIHEGPEDWEILAVPPMVPCTGAPSAI